MGSVTINVDHYGWTMVFEVEWSGSSICGRGPDDEVPDIEEINGWLENKRGDHIRDFLPKEIEELTAPGSLIDGYIMEAIHEAFNEPYDDPY